MNTTTYNAKTIGIVATATILGAGLLVATIASADNGTGYRGGEGDKPTCTEERHTAMMQAFGNNDYNAWSELMADRGRVAQVVTADSFPSFAAAHGDDVARVQVRTELGLGMKAQDGNGYRGGNDTGKGYRLGGGKGEQRGGGMGEQRGARDGTHRGSWAQ